MLTAAEQYRILVAKLESINPSTIVEEEEEEEDDDDDEDAAPQPAGAGSAVVTPQVAVQPSAMPQVAPAAAPLPAGWLSTVAADPNSVTNPTPEQLTAWANGQNPPTTWNKNRTTGKYEPPAAAAAAPVVAAPVPVAATAPQSVAAPVVAATAPQSVAAPAPASQSVAAPASNEPETSGTINRDNMSFNQAFADARVKGEKQFPWKGKKYAVQMAPAVPVTGTKAGTMGSYTSRAPSPVPAAPSAINQIQPRAPAPRAPAAPAPAPPVAAAPAPAPKKETYRGLDGKIYYKAESVTYNEDQALARIVQLARGR
jgi:hypothetical protein